MFRKDVGHYIKKIDNHLFFKGSPLSNMYYIDEYYVDGKKFSGVEQYYQYMKCRINGKTDIAEKILDTPNSFECKKLTKFRCNKDWLNDTKFLIMEKALLIKFSKSKFKNYLQSTNGFILHEATYDKIWGVGNIPDNINCVEDIKGLDILGKFLMAIRDGSTFPEIIIGGR